MAGLLPDLFGESVIVEDGINEHHTALPEVIRAVEKITGSGNLKTLDSCRKPLESYFRKRHDLCHALEEFKVILDCPTRHMASAVRLPLSVPKTLIGVDFFVRQRTEYRKSTTFANYKEVYANSNSQNRTENRS